MLNFFLFLFQHLPNKDNNKSFSSGRGSRNFSLSSERYIVNQINKSQNGNMNGHNHDNGSLDPETSIETHARVENEQHTCIVPQDEDIEKSFRVNQDGSMTVEMKVHLKIKEEEMLHWTTTLSRTSLSKRMAHPIVSESGNSSPDSNNAVAKQSTHNSEEESKEQNHLSAVRSSVGFNEEQSCNPSKFLERTKPTFKRPPTPCPRHVKKKVVKMVTGSGVQETTAGHYTYMKRTPDGDTSEGYCVVQHGSSRTKRPKPRQTTSAGPNNEGSHSSIKSSEVAKVLQVKPNGFGVRETVMHIYESQGCYDTYSGNEEYSVDSVPLHGSSPVAGSKPSNDTRQSSSNDCDIDSSWQPPVVESLQQQNEEILSLSSEPVSPSYKITNSLSSVTDNLAQKVTLHKKIVSDKVFIRDKKKTIKFVEKQNHSSLASGSDNKQEKIIGVSRDRKKSSSDKLSNKTSVGKKSLSETVKSGQNSKVTEKQTKKLISDKTNKLNKEKAFLVHFQNVKRSPPKNTNKVAPKDNGHNVNVPETKTGTNLMKKNISDILKPKSLTENPVSSPKKSLEVSESVSMPSLNPSPSNIHQYVENWLEKVSPEAVPDMDEGISEDLKSQGKVTFQLGADSEYEARNQSQCYVEEKCGSPDEILKKSSSCLSVPVCQGGPMQSVLQNAISQSVSMPTFRVSPEQQDLGMRPYKSAEAIQSIGDNISSPKENLEAVLRLICSSIQCISKASDTIAKPNFPKSSSLPDFPSQVASVFGSSCKAFLSFLSVMTLRDSLTGFVPSHGSRPRIPSEAILMMESLQKISTTENEEEQRASLLDLQKKASLQFIENWKDFQIRSEPLSPKSSAPESTLDVVSQGGDAIDEEQGINELMDEVNMPPDLRADISSSVQQAISLYPIGESDLAEIEGNQHVLEEEQLLKCCSDETATEDFSQPEQTLSEEKSSQETELGEEFQNGSDTQKEKVVGQIEEVNNEDKETENIDCSVEETGSLKDKSSEDVTEKCCDTKQCKHSDSADEVDLFKKVVKGTDHEMTVEEGEGAEEEERDDETVDSVEDDEQTDVISEKEEVGVNEEVEKEDEKVLEDKDCESVETQDEREVTDVGKEGGSQETEQENYPDEAGESEQGEEKILLKQKSMEDEERDKEGKDFPRKDDEQAKGGEIHEKSEKVNQGNVPEDTKLTDGRTSKNVIEKALYLDHHNSCDGDEAESDEVHFQGEPNTKSLNKYSSEDCCCADEKCTGTDTVTELETDEGEDRKEGINGCLTHPVEISQELLDFVNSALLSSSLIFSYDSQGNVKVAQNKEQTVDPMDSSYGLKCLPSPNTSELSDYRPDSLESGGYKTLESLDIVTDSSEEDSKKPFSACKHSAHNQQDIPDERMSVERVNSNLSLASNLKSNRSSYSNESGTKVLREDLSYFSAASSLKADNEHAPETSQCISSVQGKDSPEGVLIDQGRWLLKENHLIRRSPPLSLGMYGHLDNTSIDTSHENTGEDSPPHYQNHLNPPVALSSSELEEMARPKTPKCTYYNMPHGSDSDPFMDDVSVKSGKNGCCGFGDVKVAPQINTTTSWANKNGSLSSFASVEFKLADRKVHPEGESSAVAQARRTSSGEHSVLQSQDSLETLHWRCGQYCPIL